MLYLTIAVVVSILVVSSILYANFERVALPLLYNSARDSLIQASYSVDFMHESARNTALQVFYDSGISNLMFFSEISSSEANKAMLQLDNYRIPTNSFIHSIYVFNRKANRYYLTFPADVEQVQWVGGFFDSEITTILNDPSDRSNFSIIPRKVPMPVKGGQETLLASVYTCIFYEPVVGGPVDSAVVINISETWMREIIDSLNVDPSNDTFIIDSRGHTVTSTEREPMLADVSAARHVARILASDDPSGYFLERVHGTKSLVAYVSSQSLDWRFVRVIPYAKIIGKINRMRYNTAFIALAILLGGILASYAISRRLHRPIEDLLARFRNLEREKKKNAQLMRAGLIRDLLHGKHADDLEGIESTLSDAAVDLNRGSTFVVVLLHIDGYAAFHRDRADEDAEAMESKLAGIVADRLVDGVRAEVAELERGELPVVFDCGMAVEDEAIATVSKITASVQATARRTFGLTVSATLSSAAEKIDSLSRLYEEALEYANYRLFEGPGCTITVREVRLRDAEEYAYPSEKEKELVDALMLGDTGSARRAVREIFESTEGYPYSVFNLAVARLFTTVHSATNLIKRNNNVSTYFNLGTFMQGLKECNSVEDVGRRFSRLFDTITEHVEQAKIQKHMDLHDRVAGIVAERYRDPNLSLNLIADEVGMSPTYLGRLIKKTNRESVADMINNYRLDKAKDLLRETQKPIHEIIEEVGMTNRPYFYTLFKKKLGATPSDYRRNTERGPIGGRA